jgi:hypothetical protein
VRLLRQAKNQIPEDVTASGWLNAEFLLRSDARSIRNSVINGRLDALPPWSGTGSASDVRLLSNAGKDEVAIATVPLALGGADSQETSQVAKRGRPKKEEQQREQEPAEPRLRIGPMAVAMNASEPVNAGGWISPGGYRFFLRGDMDLKDLFRLEDVFGLPVGRPAAEGSAKLDVSVSGPWQGFAPPATLGTAQLHNVRAEVHGLNTPIEIGSATLSLTPEAALLQKISARTGSTHWSGGVTAPRHCAVPGCTVQFDLTADQLSTGDFAEWFTPPSARRPWYRILNSTSEPQGSSPLLAIQARGNLQVGRFGLKKVVATQVATQVDLDRGKITLTGLRGQLLQGTHQGNWIIDASHRDVSGQDTSRGLVRYHGSGALRNISLAQVGALMNDAWITGTADGNFDLDGAGDSLHELVSRSDGKLQFVMRNGSLTHVEIPGAAGPLPVHRFAGELHLRKSAWELSAGRLESRDGFYQARGTASAGSGLDFVLTRSDGRSWTFAGTLAMPRVAAVSRTNADAKPVKP